MYERLEEARERDLERFAEERAAWQQTEAALRQEAAELRAQLLYAVAQLNALQAQVAAGGSMPGKAGAAPFPPVASSTASHYPSSSHQAAIAGREPAAALPSSSGLSGAEQVKALIDAMKPAASPASGGSQPQAAFSSSSSSSAPVSPAEAWPEGAEDELPAYAADLAAAVAAVDATDVLTGVSSYYSVGARKAAAATTAAEAASSTTEAAAPTAVPQQQQPAAAPAAAQRAATQQAAADRGPPPPLTLGADDIYWVNQVGQQLLHACC